MGWNDYYRFRFRVARARGTHEAGSLRGVIMGFGLLLFYAVIVAQGRRYSPPGLDVAILLVMFLYLLGHLAEFHLVGFVSAVAAVSAAMLLGSLGYVVAAFVDPGTNLASSLALVAYCALVLGASYRRLRQERAARARPAPER